MRLRTRTLILMSLVLVMGAVLLWRSAPHRRSSEPAPDFAAASSSSVFPPVTTASPGGGGVNVAVEVSSWVYGSVMTNGLEVASPSNRLAYRVSNTPQGYEELVRSERAVLLRNALIDTGVEGPKIPEHLRAKGDPGSYIVQARGMITEEFRGLLRAAGAEIVSYVPNNAFLVRANGGTAQALKSSPLVQGVLGFEPYYKLDAALLRVAVKRELSPYGLLVEPSGSW